MANKTHTNLSPSTSHRWMNCPGSVALCASMPKEAQSKYGAEGTAAHQLLEKCLKNLKNNPYDYVGDEFNDFTVTEEMAEAVSFAVEYVKNTLQQCGGDLWVERTISIRPNLDGTLDIAIIQEDLGFITVIDFKYGKGILVSALENSQLLLYLVPLAAAFKATRYKLVVIQPRTEEQVNEWECDRRYLDVFEKELDRRIELTKEKDAALSTGDWCKWCNAKAVCPALRKKAIQSLPIIKGAESLFPDVKTLTAQVLKITLDNRDIIVTFLDAAAAYAQEYVEAGGQIDGYGLQPKRAIRRWRNEQEVIDNFVDLQQQIYKISLISPAQMEKIAGKERVARYTEVPDTGMVLKKIKTAKTKVTQKDVIDVFSD